MTLNRARMILGVIIVVLGLAAGLVMAGDITRDNHGPNPLPEPAPRRLPYAGAGAVAFLAAALFVWRRPEPPSVHEIAFAKLQEARVFMNAHAARAFAVAVSGAIREYIEVRFGLPATMRTTEEFLHGLRTDRPELLNGFSEPLADFLAHCDFAKFGGRALSGAQMDAMHRSAWMLVEKARERS